MKVITNKLIGLSWLNTRTGTAPLESACSKRKLNHSSLKAVQPNKYLAQEYLDGEVFL